PGAAEGSVLVRAELGRHVPLERPLHRRQGGEEVSADPAGSAAVMRVGSLATSFALTLVLSGTAHAQRGRGTPSGEKPAVDVVQTVGCVERRDGNPETWSLTRAADPRTVQPGVFSTGQVDAA